MVIPVVNNNKEFYHFDIDPLTNTCRRVWLQSTPDATTCGLIAKAPLLKSTADILKRKGWKGPALFSAQAVIHDIDPISLLDAQILSQSDHEITFRIVFCSLWWGSKAVNLSSLVPGVKKLWVALCGIRTPLVRYEGELEIRITKDPVRVQVKIDSGGWKELTPAQIRNAQVLDCLPYPRNHWGFSSIKLCHPY